MSENGQSDVILIIFLVGNFFTTCLYLLIKLELSPLKKLVLHFLQTLIIALSFISFVHATIVFIGYFEFCNLFNKISKSV